MLPKQNKEKNVKPKSKNIIIPKNNIIKNTLINSQINSNSNSNKSENKFATKRIKNNSIPNYIDKNMEKKENYKKKINIRNYDSNHLTYKPKANTEKNNKIINRINTEKNKDNVFNIGKLSNVIKNADLKQTIIIDNDGNNNLNLLLDKNKKKYSEKKIYNKKDKKKNRVEEIINDDYFNCNFTSILIDASEQKTLMDNKIDEKKSMGKDLNLLMNNIENMNKTTEKKEDNSRDKNSDKDNKRLNEYGQIFKLLNENIEQFKNIINKKDNNNNINTDNNNNKGIKSDKFKILTSRETHKNTITNANANTNINKIKKSEKLVPFYDKKVNKCVKRNKANKQKNTLFEQKNTYQENNNKKNQLLNSHNFNKDKKNSELYSFLNSFTEEDLFKELDHKHHKNSSKSLTNLFTQDKKEDNSKKTTKNEIEKISTNDMSRNNKCYKCINNDDDMQIDYFGTDEQIRKVSIKNREINPHFFSSDFVNNVNSNEKKKENSNKECFVF